MTVADPALPRLFVIMGSGETSPTMISVHQDLFARFQRPRVPAVLLDTPFGFQENAADVAARAVAYFRDHVGREVAVASLRSAEAATALELETLRARLAEALYVFAGPGSPTYAIRQWQQLGIREPLAEKLRSGGCLVFASAAAVGLGELAIPVYEIYKVGEDPRWIEGLDLLRELGLRCAVVPHYDNAEGGTHDTRYCYMGERRMRALEAMLPAGVFILGVDEHTACVFDLASGSFMVRGRGAVTVRRSGGELRFQGGPHLVTDLMGEIRGSKAPRGEARSPVGAPASHPGERMRELSATAGRALEEGDVEAAVAAALEMESTIDEWSADTLEGGEKERARAALRPLIVRLGAQAAHARPELRKVLAPLVDELLRLRAAARDGRRWEEADRLRKVLEESGVEIRDSPSGSGWDLRI